MYFSILTRVENAPFNSLKIGKVLLENIDSQHLFSKMEDNFMEIDFFILSLFDLNALHFIC